MPGGNSSSSKRPYRNLKGGGQRPYDVRALSGGETFGSDTNMQLFEREGEDYEDTEYGLSKWKPTPEGGGYKGNSQGNTYEHPNVGSPVPARTTKPKKGDAHPGGGW